MTDLSYALIVDTETSMNINFKNTRYEPDQTLIRDTTKKIEALERFMGGDASGAIVSMELEQAVGGKQKGDIWRAEINIDHEGVQYRAESTKAKLDHAITTVLRDVARELRRARNKDTDMFRKGGATIKSFLRGFGNK